MKISIVIASYNSETLLLRALESICKVNYPYKDFEVLVVDDGSTDNTKKAVDRFKRVSPFSIKYFWRENAGPGPAKNIGIKHARGRIIAFTDADCVVDKNWLNQIEKSVIDEHNELVGGKTYNHETLIFPWVVAPIGQVGIGANFAVDTSKTEKIYFDENYYGLLCQDTDLINRIEDRQQVKLKYIPEMLINHPVNVLNLRGVLTKAKSRHNEVQLYKRYGQRVVRSMHPIFRPLILGHISPAALVTVASILSLIVLAFINIYFCTMVIVSAALLFILILYKKFVTNTQEPQNISVFNRLKTFIYLTIYLCTYVVARIRGSVKYGYFLV